MKNKSIYFFLALFTTFIITSCSTDDGATDTVSPSITIITPQDQDEFELGETIQVKLEFTDDVSLASYKVDIHFAGDGHSHDSRGEYEEWDFEMEGTLSGTSQIIHTEIEIPEISNGKPIKEGEYHFGVYCLDAAGNETVAWRKIKIETHPHTDQE